MVPEASRVNSSYLRKPLLAAIRAAGAQPWPKLWTALRATRDTELRESFPVHVVEAWIGHEDRVAKRNYTQVIEDHFQRAINSTEEQGGENPAHLAQNPAQQASGGSCKESQRSQHAPAKPVVFATTDNTLPLPAETISGDDRT